MHPDRRSFLKRTLTASAAVALGPAHWRRAFGAHAAVGESPYGPLGAADSNGIRLPTGFTSRLIAMTGQEVGKSGYVWHAGPDGGATYAAGEGGWVYVSNSELNGTRGGASAIRFASDGRIVSAYRILGGTRRNCAGGATPWATWLSCEEYHQGLVWECNPFEAGQGIARPAMGRFAHEAAVVDPRTGYVYLTEDAHDGRFYRFRPASARDLSAGTLEAASVEGGFTVTWIPVSRNRPHRGRDTAVFARGEGAWFSSGHVYFCTTGDNRVWALETATDKLEIIYDATKLGTNAPLREPDNLTVHERSGDIYVAEDGAELQLVLLAERHGQRILAPFLQLVGHVGSEVVGPAFSPDGTRLCFSSQRGTDGGIDGPGKTFEVTGPFRPR